jgi:uncharacterized protein YjbJ (UPF0337 family)
MNEQTRQTKKINGIKVVEQKSTTAPTGAHPQLGEPSRQSTLTFTQSEDPTVRAPFKNTLKVATQPQRAAMGGNEPMNQQAQQSMPNMGAIKGQWMQKMGEAKAAWGKLTDDELMQAEGDAEKLTGLIQERYAINREEAESQVKAVLEKN